jgi:predicted permease
MSSQTIKSIAFLVLLIHGIGHLQGVVSSAGVKFRNSSSNRSWLLRSMGDQWNRLICLILYLAAGILGIFAALIFLGLFGPESQWTSLALSCAIFSTIGLVLFPKALAMFFNKAGAITVNLIIFYSILLNGQWPAAIFEN